MYKKELSKFIRIIDECTVGKGYIDLYGGLLNDKEYELEICDGYNHSWFYETVKINEFDTCQELLLYFAHRLEEFDPAEELETIIKSEIPGKPDVTTLVDIYNDVCESVDMQISYLYEHANPII